MKFQHLDHVFNTLRLQRDFLQQRLQNPTQKTRYRMVSTKRTQKLKESQQWLVQMLQNMMKENKAR